LTTAANTFIVDIGKQTRRILNERTMGRKVSSKDSGRLCI